MRFLFFTDSHIRGNSPRSRTDDFYSTLKNKFNEIIEIINKFDVDYVLHGGDWFDRPDISPSIVREFAMIIRKFGKPIYTVAGNHDIFGYNPETLSRTMLGLLEGTDILNILKYGQPITLEKDGIRVQIYGNSYNCEIDGEKSQNYYIVKKDSGVNYCINIVHGMLLTKPFIEGLKYTLVDKILSTEADVTLAGHYHTGFGIKKIEEKYFVNPGGIARVSSQKSEITRKPQVVIIDFKNKIEIWSENLKSALPGEEILNREHIEMAQNREYKLNQFFQNIEASGEYEHVRIDINKMIEEIASSQGLKEEVKKETIKRIDQARQSLAGEEVEY